MPIDEYKLIPKHVQRFRIEDITGFLDVLRKTGAQNRNAAIENYCSVSGREYEARERTPTERASRKAKYWGLINYNNRGDNLELLDAGKYVLLGYDVRKPDLAYLAIHWQAFMNDAAHRILSYFASIVSKSSFNCDQAHEFLMRVALGKEASISDKLNVNTDLFAGRMETSKRFYDKGSTRNHLSIMKELNLIDTLNRTYQVSYRDNIDINLASLILSHLIRIVCEQLPGQRDSVEVADVKDLFTAATFLNEKFFDIVISEIVFDSPFILAHSLDPQRASYVVTIGKKQIGLLRCVKMLTFKDLLRGSK